MFSPHLERPEGALDTIKDQVCLDLTLMDQKGPWDTIKDQVCLDLTLMDQKGPWTPSRTRFV